MKPSEIAALVEGDHGALWGQWVPLPGTDLEVTAQPLRLDGPRGPLVTVSAAAAQRICDALGCYPTTALIEDLIWKHAAVCVRPLPRKNTGTWEQSLEYSAYSDRWLASVDPGVLCADGGKVWALDDSHRPLYACNYGMHVAVSWLGRDGMYLGTPIYHSVSDPDLYVLQGLDDFHNAGSLRCGIDPGDDNEGHSDYSQRLRGCRPRSGVTPREALIHHSGRPLRSLRLV